MSKPWGQLRQIFVDFSKKPWTLRNNYKCIKDEAPHANSTYFKGLTNFAKLLLEASKPNWQYTLLPSLVESRWLCYRVYGQKNMTNTIQWSALFTVKVRMFWEGHKIWKNLPLKIWRYSITSNFKWKIFFLIMWPSQNIRTLRLKLIGYT